MTTHTALTEEISQHIWRTKYRYRPPAGGGERTIDDTWRRIAIALAAEEPQDQDLWAERFYGILEGFRFLPAGRIQAGAGTPHQVTLFNCFVMGVIEDSIEEHFREPQGGRDHAATGRRGRLRLLDAAPARHTREARGDHRLGPGLLHARLGRHVRHHAVDRRAARRDDGDLALRSSRHRRVRHGQAAAGRLRHFNLSVQVTDVFMAAVREGGEWPLVFPAEALEDGGSLIDRGWTGTAGPVPCRILRTVPARALWNGITRATYDYAEPGVLFVDQINRTNNLGDREHITATNPCGEVPLPPYGACDLGSINLTAFVREPFTDRAWLDLDQIRATAEIATRLLDDVIDASRFPLEAQRREAQGSRRIGLGITGLADALIMLGLRYDHEAALEVAADAMRAICHAAYRSSIALAREKGSFPYFERDQYLGRPFVSVLPEDIQDGIARHGIRNSHLTAIAPAGTISLLANNISSGLEPVFALRYERKVLNQDGATCTFELTDYAWRLWRELHGPSAPLPPAFLQAHEIPPRAHLAMQAALQLYVDSSISKTINVPEDYPFANFKDIYRLAFEQGLKGCTTFRPNPITGEVLKGAVDGAEAPHCCAIEREAD